MHLRTILFAMCCGMGLGPAWAEIDGHGPDAWRVTGVARDDVLNMRMGPGTEYPVIDQLPPDARALEQITCVPLLIPSIANRLTQAQRARLPQRWCLMRTADTAKAGWVAQRFLMEDTGQTVAPPATDATQIPMQQTGDPLIDAAARVVHDLYAAFEAADSREENPFAPANAPRFFHAGIVPDLRGHGADLLYDAQDFQGSVTRIAPDPDTPMFRGTIRINAVIQNFGRSSSAVFHLRADPDQADAPFRIFRIEHDGWSFPD